MVVVAVVLGAGGADAAAEESHAAAQPRERETSCNFVPSGKVGFGAAAHSDAPIAFSFNARASVYNALIDHCHVFSPRVGYQYDASSTAGGHFATLSPALIYTANKVGFALLPTLLVGDSRADLALGFSPTAQVNVLSGLVGLELAPERIWATRGPIFDAVRLHLTFDVGAVIAILWALKHG